MSKIDIKLLKIQVQKEVEKADDLKELDEVFGKYLGKNGEIVLVLRSLGKLPKGKRAKLGKEANDFKNFLREKIEQKKSFFVKTSAIVPLKNGTSADKPEDREEWIDITRPGTKSALGHLHPLTLTKRRVEEIFQTMGFSIIEGTEMENEWYNFDALNIPKDHPSRDLWDTFYLKTELPEEAKVKMKTKFSSPNGLLLRTHTSPVQIRYMEKNQPPIKIIAPGRVFRHESIDASHESNFYQIEGLMVDKAVSVANFKAIIGEFLGRFFQKPVKIRLIPSFFPFVEPGFQVDISCVNCGGKGCSVCSKTGWLEMMGAGMVHPNVLKATGLNPKFWQGFAFGMGMERLAMMKYKINDIRLFYSGDLRFLNQF